MYLHARESIIGIPSSEACLVDAVVEVAILDLELVHELRWKRIVVWRNVRKHERTHVPKCLEFFLSCHDPLVFVWALLRVRLVSWLWW